MNKRTIFVVNAVESGALDASINRDKVEMGQADYPLFTMPQGTSEYKRHTGQHTH